MKTHKKRRPWNAVSQQVYSISSVHDDGLCNMNIATYVTAVTMEPKRYMIAIYRNTKTHDNVFNTKRPFLLQGLSLSQINLVKVLGKKSGKKMNKQAYITKKDIAYSHYNNCIYLNDSAFVLAMDPEQFIVLDDHDLVIARVTKIVMQKHDGVHYLTTHDLQESGIIG